ncbi:hypothetical protein [Flavobacterium agrisoli]|uniref:Alpha-ketoglutarate decarboxylase n=1 Tax=Flavobacterium agrisoli TaxID=2793066 RepID=A0A934UJF5_9FLAO|nr:hypothetical protein [Flavobacterium agrisoli]MBK0369360.1 hypothetical protein [Flavobacterium agrisoli]
MNKHQPSIVFLYIFSITFLLFAENSNAQQSMYNTTPTTSFWDKVQFGGGLGLNFGSGYTDIAVSPSAIYNINPVVAVGASLLFGYVNTDSYHSIYYGGSVIGLVNPIPQLQLSAELEQTRFNTDYNWDGGNFSDNYWNTALYLGAGFRTKNVTIGIRYDVLYDKNKSIYAEPYMPFVRVYF